jgi:2-polyprenyl-3-methyl-5-hydroxy-6-metoxy-1,4-benzoquinol methylase
MSFLSKFFRNTRRPEGIGSRLMLSMMNAGHNKNALWGFSYIEIPPIAEILDIGGGGRNIAHLLQRVQNGKVYGADYAPESVSFRLEGNGKWLCVTAQNYAEPTGGIVL